MKLSKYPFLLLFSGILFLSLAQSCKTTKAAQGKTLQLDNALLWEINGPGMKAPSYLYGTIHLIDSKDFFLPKGTMSAIDASKKVVFEIDMNEMSDISAMMGIMNKVFMDDGKTLKDLMSAADYDLVSTHFQKIGLPLFMLERMKPMFLSVFASGDMDPNALKTGSMKSYEMEFLDMAKNAGKTTGGLETIDFQLGLFDQIPYEAQAKMLLDAIKNGDGGDDSMKQMTEMYLSQNITLMASMINDEKSDIAGFEDMLLTQRNINWIPLIIETSKTEATFFAVGAGHLGGEKGVITLLRKAGMKVTPVK